MNLVYSQDRDFFNTKYRPHISCLRWFVQVLVLECASTLPSSASEWITMHGGI